MNKRRVNLIVGLAIIIAIIVVVAIYKFQPFHLQSHISVSSDTYTVTDKTGKFIINPQFDSAWFFSDGLALVEVGKKWGYIDKTGKFVINPQFDSADFFSDGLALVEVGKKWGYIHR
jgi:hypothetical protein